MWCRAVQRNMVTYVDGQLTGRSAEAMRRHVAGCLACARAQQRFASLNTLLKTQPALSMSDDFACRVVEAVAHAPSPVPARWALPRLFALPILAQAAAVVAVSILGVQLGVSMPEAPLASSEHRVFSMEEFGHVEPASLEDQYLNLMHVVAADQDQG